MKSMNFFVCFAFRLIYKMNCSAAKEKETIDNIKSDEKQTAIDEKLSEMYLQKEGLSLISETKAFRRTPSRQTSKI